MQKIDKSAKTILSTKYKTWLSKQTPPQDKNYRYYYDDVAMNLYRCQSGVCAYTEMWICIPELYASDNWAKGRHKISSDADYRRNDHFGELEHYDPSDKKQRYWNWDNLFMIHSKVNDIKSDTPTVTYLKPDLPGYSPEKYFDYDPETNRFVPNVGIDDPVTTKEIQNMIDHVLCLNHGIVRKERENYINEVRSKQARGEAVQIDRFFTSVKWVLDIQAA